MLTERDWPSGIDDDDEQFAGLTSDNRVVFTRTVGAQNDISIVNAMAPPCTLAATTNNESFAAIAPITGSFSQARRFSNEPLQH